MPRSRYLLLAALVVPLAVWARWHGAPVPKGSRFHPWPDAVEYAAEAQALARSGQVFLQIGPLRVRPRYPPGWPLLLAPVIRLGVEGQDLWRVTALFGGALAWLLAVLAAHATAALAPESRSGIAPLLAGLLAGCVWALAPIAVDLGQTLMSDEPALLISLTGLLLAGVAFVRRPREEPGTSASPSAARRFGRSMLRPYTGHNRSSGTLAMAAVGGLAFGLAASMRSVVAVLMVPPLALLFLAGIRKVGLGAGLARLTAWAAGALIFPAITILILVRSGWPAWEWSGYRFWTPQRYSELGTTFNLRYALTPDVAFRQEIQGRPLSHLELAARVLLGIPGLGVRHYLGLWWPALAWLAAIPLFRAAKRRGGAVAELAPWLAGALLAWTLGHLAAFSLYFYPASRFYLGPLALCLVLVATTCGVALARPRRSGRIAAELASILVFLLTVQGFVTLRGEPPPGLRRERTRANFNRWLRMRDDKRAGQAMPFDPVHAQALGLLTPEVAARTRVWGELPNTVHVRRLRANGFLKKALTPPSPSLPSSQPPAGREGV